jgi:hypothetical protein
MVQHKPSHAALEAERIIVKQDRIIPEIINIYDLRKRIPKNFADNQIDVVIRIKCPIPFVFLIE